MEFQELCQVKEVAAALVQVEARLRLETGFSLNQSFALCCLARGALTPTELARELKIMGPSLSRLLRGLVAQGLVRRDLHAPDARQKLLSLTEKGRAQSQVLHACELKLFPLEIPERPLALSQ